MRRFAAGASGIVLAGALLAAPPVAGAEDDNRWGKLDASLRYRYETVDQQGLPEDAHAGTVRVRGSYTSSTVNGLSVFGELDWVTGVDADNFNSGAGTSGPGRAQYPVVADPNGGDLNQLYLQAAGERWRARLGRQRILLDDQRHVGGVGWRQNEQTYDGVSLSFDPGADTAVFYAWVESVNRIFGDRVAAGAHEQDTHLLNVRHRLNDSWTVTGYAYLIDNDDAPALSTNTAGLRLTGSLDTKERLGGNLKVHAEYARQSDADNAPAGFDANYVRLQADWQRDALQLGVLMEVLGDDSGQGFRTPLATLHAFNGWADVFLNTPADGLADLSARVSWKIAGWRLQARLHDFSSADTDLSYGHELDLAVSRPLGECCSVLIKGARFEGNRDAFPDTTKFWLMFSARL